jgi:hypothetical protein
MLKSSVGCGLLPKIPQLTELASRNPQR